MKYIMLDEERIVCLYVYFPTHCVFLCVPGLFKPQRKIELILNLKKGFVV